MRTINRVTPLLPVQQMKTYAITSPLTSHYRRATCEEAGCGAYERGWRTTCDEKTELGTNHAQYIRGMSGRRYTESKDEEGRTVFTFEPGQPCFAQSEHRVFLDRPSWFLVKNGDWRQSETVRIHQKAEDWIEDFREHHDKLTKEI